MGATFLDGHDEALGLRCPVCRTALHFGPKEWFCSAQLHVFPDVNGVPILLNEARSLFRAADFDSGARTTFKDPPSWALRLGQILPSPSRDVSSTNCQREIARLLEVRAPDRRRVLVVGCGDGTAGYGQIAGVGGTRWLETDVSLAGRAAVVCDASDLPFEDGAFDLVICIAVLEHVLEPQRCVDEMHRVLTADGFIYATTPFMQQVHMGEYDFMRFTRSGHRWLFRNFVELASGVATGPASALVWSLEYFLLSWTSSIMMRRILKGLTRVLLGWMTLLDSLLARRPAAFDAAGGFYFIGRRSSGPTVCARDMMGYYQGADALK